MKRRPSSGLLGSVRLVKLIVELPCATRLGATKVTLAAGRSIPQCETCIVFPHVESAEEAALAVSSMGSNVWPAAPDGIYVNILLIEDQVGIANAREIVSTRGVSIVFPGPGDLRRAYESDMEAVENASQTVLAACKEFDVPCGITAGVDDIGAAGRN